MATVIEAASLGAVTDLAAHPPATLTTPTNVPRHALTLYIAKVPGSQDVFLTPLKPRDRIVTAEDVQSSLYYVHIHQLDDRRHSVSSDYSSLSATTPQHCPKENRPIARRPLSTIVHTNDPAQIASGSPKRIVRKPVRPMSLSKDVLHSTDHALPVLPPRPSRPLPAIPDGDIPWLDHQDQGGQLRSPLSDYRTDFDPRHRIEHSDCASIADADAHRSGSLTLIRRDPSSGEQWNVATIDDAPIEEVSSATIANGAARRIKKAGVPLYLSVTNPAYLQYNRSDSRMNDSSSESTYSCAARDSSFLRRLYMPGSRFREHGYATDAKSFISNVSSDILSMRKTMRRSQVITPEPDSPVHLDSRSKGYAFVSPWDTQCEFSTGTAGRSLKCRHQLHDHLGARMSELSELRFNLPTASRNKHTGLSEKRSSYFAHHRTDSMDFDDDTEAPAFVITDDGRIDLSLGRERAGGGFAGRQAKLGKLIVQPEGMKMLDLLVAANMALWWRAYAGQ